MISNRYAYGGRMIDLGGIAKEWTAIFFKKDFAENDRRTPNRERNSMRKHISEMTPADKASFLKATKRALLIEQGVPWEVIEPNILAEIDATFDDAQFVKMDPDSRIDAAYARKEFGDKKPSLID